MVPVDGSMLAALIGEEKPAGDRLATVRTLYDAVLARMDYDKPAGEPWGRGDARWACDAGFGNCTDIHSLFIAACRDLHIPAAPARSAATTAEPGSSTMITGCPSTSPRPTSTRRCKTTTSATSPPTA